MLDLDMQREEVRVQSRQEARHEAREYLAAAADNDFKDDLL